MKTLIKIDRLSAWVLFITLVLYFISGYGMTKGLIDSTLATKLHLSSLTYIILFSFTIHTAYAIRLALMRWGIWNNFFIKFLWAMFYIIFFLGFVFVDLYYKTPSKPETKNINASTSVAATTSQTNNATSTVKTFTLQELSKYNGKNGMPSFVAVDGNVYDLTQVFQQGSHFSHTAGTDLSNAFYSRHVKSALSKYPVVGKLVN